MFGSCYHKALISTEKSCVSRTGYKPDCNTGNVSVLVSDCEKKNGYIFLYSVNFWFQLYVGQDCTLTEGIAEQKVLSEEKVFSSAAPGVQQLI